MEYLLLWLHSLAAATLLPIGSEPTLLYLLEGGAVPLWALLVATTGNTLGAVVNWCLGRYMLRFQHKKWFPVTADSLASAQSQFSRRGVWVLLFAWVPIVGDPLTFVAGMLRVHIGVFLLLVGLGKSLRYMVFILPYWV